jgi:hypothetical protein
MDEQEDEGAKAAKDYKIQRARWENFGKNTTDFS